MEEKKSFCEEHKEINAVCYCVDCHIYLCNKCVETFHSKLFENHISYKIDKINPKSFTGFYSKDNHLGLLDFYCKNHNKLYCASCFFKKKNEKYGQIVDCQLVTKIRHNKYINDIFLGNYFIFMITNIGFDLEIYSLKTYKKVLALSLLTETGPSQIGKITNLKNFEVIPESGYDLFIIKYALNDIIALYSISKNNPYELKQIFIKRYIKAFSYLKSEKNILVLDSYYFFIKINLKGNEITKIGKNPIKLLKSTDILYKRRGNSIYLSTFLNDKQIFFYDRIEEKRIGKKSGDGKNRERYISNQKLININDLKDIKGIISIEKEKIEKDKSYGLAKVEKIGDDIFYGKVEFGKTFKCVLFKISNDLIHEIHKCEKDTDYEYYIPYSKDICIYKTTNYLNLLDTNNVNIIKRIDISDICYPGRNIPKIIFKNNIILFDLVGICYEDKNEILIKKLI